MDNQNEQEASPRVLLGKIDGVVFLFPPAVFLRNFHPHWSRSMSKSLSLLNLSPFSCKHEIELKKHYNVIKLEFI
jgi:hypothetical protein